MHSRILPQLRMAAACFSCYLSLAVSGMCLSWTEPLTSWFQSNSSTVLMSESEVSLVVSLVEVGATFSPIPAAVLADRVGRKWSLMLTASIALLAWLLALFVRTFPSLCVCRLLSGIALGSAPTVAPVYLAEVVPANIRGTLSGQLSTMFFLGQLFVYATGHSLSYTGFLWTCTALPLLTLGSLLLLPESPYHLLKKGQREAALAALERLRGPGAEQEIDRMAADLPAQEQGSGGSAWAALLPWNSMKLLLLLQLLSFVSHMNGLPTLSAYATDTFGGRSWLTVGMGGVLASSSFLAAFLTDRCGRRPLLIASLAGSAVSTSLLALYFYLRTHVSLLYVGVIGFCVISSLGSSPLIMTLQAELFPTSTRALASGITELTLSVSSFLCLIMYLPINNTLGVHVNFVIYTVLSVIGVLAVVFFLPETSKVPINS